MRARRVDFQSIETSHSAKDASTGDATNRQRGHADAHSSKLVRLPHGVNMKTLHQEVSKICHNEDAEIFLRRVANSGRKTGEFTKENITGFMKRPGVPPHHGVFLLGSVNKKHWMKKSTCQHLSSVGNRNMPSGCRQNFTGETHQKHGRKYGQQL